MIEWSLVTSDDDDSGDGSVNSNKERKRESKSEVRKQALSCFLSYFVATNTFILTRTSYRNLEQRR